MRTREGLAGDFAGDGAGAVPGANPRLDTMPPSLYEPPVLLDLDESSRRLLSRATASLSAFRCIRRCASIVRTARCIFCRAWWPLSAACAAASV